MQPRLRQRRKEQIRSRQTPDDRSLRPSRDPGCEQRGRSSIDRAGTTASELVQCAMGQAAAGKDGVYVRDAEREAASSLHAVAFYRGDAIAQIGKDLLAGSRHRSRNPFGSRWFKMTASCSQKCLMFFFCSVMNEESRRRKSGIRSHNFSIREDYLGESVT